MTVQIEQESRRQMLEFLPEALRKALHSYHRFTDDDTPAEDMSKKSPIKDFSDHHAAAKVAVAHIELLIKLAERIGPGGEGGDNAMERMLEQAVREANAYYAQEVPPQKDSGPD